MKKEHVLIVAFAIAFVLANSFSMAQNRVKRGNADYKKLGTEIQEFAKKEILPVMSEWKAKFDNSLTTDDLNQLNELRAKAKEIRINARTEMRTTRPNRDSSIRTDRRQMMEMRKGKNFTPDEMKAMRQERRQMGNAQADGGNQLGRMGDFRQPSREKMEAVIVELIPFIERNQSKIDALKPEFDAKANEWKEKISVIVEEWKQSVMSDTANNDGRRGRNFRSGKMLHKHDLNQRRILCKFLLWDGNMEALEGEFGANANMFESNQIMGVNVDMSAPLNIQATPNPFTEKLNVSFYLNEPQNVKVRLIDAAGKEVAGLHDGELKSGQQQLNFDAKAISGLTAGAYYITLEGKTFKKTIPVAFSK